MKRALLIACAALPVLAACAHRDAADSANIASAAVGDAVSQPLKEAMKDPYQNPGRIDCGRLEHEVRALDLALGPDVDLPEAKTGATRQAAEAVAGAAGNAVGDVVGDMIPFRSLVRRLTGAEENAQEMRDALKAGDIRRAYLKGLGLERGCAYPAAPAPLPAAKNAVAAAAPADPAPSAATPAPTAEAVPPQPAATQP